MKSNNGGGGGGGGEECKSQNNASDAINQTDVETIQNKTNQYFWFVLIFKNMSLSYRILHHARLSVAPAESK